MEELRKPSGDGKEKRSRGEKPPWYRDDSHEAAIYSHLAKWKRNEMVDSDSGAHPLVHLAWRALAIACRETRNVPLTQTLRTWEDGWASEASISAKWREIVTPIEADKLDLFPKAPESPPNRTDTDMRVDGRDDPSSVLESLPEAPCCGDYFNNATRCFDCPRYR